jgi:hypothetical protein
MHAYLLIGEEEQTAQATQKLADSLKAKIFDFPLNKIEDVRALNSFVGLSLASPTAIVAKDLNQATLEALNAFLKNLEEPQAGLYYILTSPSLRNLPETIISRCQVRLLKRESGQDEALILPADDFLKAGVGEKLALVSSIKDRGEAKDFTNNLILGLHSLMLSQNDPTIYSRAIRVASFTQRALEANGNVTIQLANLAVSLV